MSAQLARINGSEKEQEEYQIASGGAPTVETCRFNLLQDELECGLGNRKCLKWSST